MASRCQPAPVLARPGDKLYRPYLLFQLILLLTSLITVYTREIMK